ncbi:cupin domain-containing protein [Pseudonocardia sp. ICBG1034]|uniref:cupin domain-containing protein n=1 Tax=Pseudonocardia sp. ICBG1034 TaxID=2844381 RepID=UPI001CCCA003|nr:cupin domain-containing protein [Pseudonocardia sp. ICBG1034]
MTSVAEYRVHGSTPNPAPEEWGPFEWDEPRLGRQVAGEMTVFRPHGTSGSLQAGFWRTGPTAPGANPDGSHTIVYSSPLGDETAVVLEGSATVTVNATGEKHELVPGSVLSHPKGVELTWEVRAPYFKKYWVIWDGTDVNPAAPTEVTVVNHNDNPQEWAEYHFIEPAEGPQVAGELFFIREGGSTGTHLSGVWRSGKGIAGSDTDPDGTLRTPYTGVLGDETILLLEGEVEVRETESGRVTNYRAGDLIGLNSGQHITWTSKGPFTKKLWVITKDRLPE